MSAEQIEVELVSLTLEPCDPDEPTLPFQTLYSPPVILISADNDRIQTTYKAACLSGTISSSLYECGYDGDSKEPWIIPVPAVCTSTLKMVTAWSEYHQHDAPVSEEVAKARDLLPWDVEFLSIDNQELFNLILAANFLDIQGLMDVTCRTVANMIKGKSSAEIREAFGITSDDEESPDGPTALSAAAMKLATANLREVRQEIEREMESRSRSQSTSSSYEEYDYS